MTLTVEQMKKLEQKGLDCIRNHTHRLVEHPTESDIERRELSIYVSGWREGFITARKRKGWRNPAEDDLPGNYKMLGEILADPGNLRNFAVCASENKMCCHHARCPGRLKDEGVQKRKCRLCWLDFLANDKGPDLSCLDRRNKC